MVARSGFTAKKEEALLSRFFSLPAAETAGAAIVSDNEAVRDWKSSGTVLVIDDEEAVRNVARMMLERVGFTVLTAVDGREGLEVFEQRADEIDRQCC